MDDLTKLAIKHQTDKWGGHFYTQHYHSHLKHLREAPINLLEIGIGGYNDPVKGGESLRMWQDYFPNGKIYGIDIADKCLHDTERIKTFRGSQVDSAFLDSVVSQIGKVDIIIDDGSHINSHIIATFNHLFPLLADNGIYIVEDLQTSYWESYGGSSFNLDRSRTAVNFFKSRIDGLNHQEIINPKYVSSYCDQHIVSLSWYHNMVFVQKGLNDEKSNVVCGNRRNGQAESLLGYYRRVMKSKISGIFKPNWNKII
jgi:demethylmacrocin O-methyltransferase